MQSLKLVSQSKLALVICCAFVTLTAVAAPPQRTKQLVRQRSENFVVRGSGVWVFSGVDGRIVSTTDDKVLRLQKGDTVFNPNIGSGDIVLKDSTGEFRLAPNTRYSLDGSDQDSIGIYIEEGSVTSTEYANLKTGPRKRRQRTTKSLSVSPGGYKNHYAKWRQNTVYSQFTVTKDTTQDIVRVTVHCDVSSTKVYRNGLQVANLGPGASHSMTE